MLAIQVVGIVALILDIFSVQLKYRKNILLVKVLASSSWVAHFALLGATAGAAMNTVGIVRSLAFYKWSKQPRPIIVLWTIVGLSVIVTAFTWQGYASLLPMSAMIIAALAFWQRSEQLIRLLLLGTAPLWMIYNFMYHSYAGMASDTLAIVSIGLALYRYRHQGLEPAKSSSARKRSRKTRRSHV